MLALVISDMLAGTDIKSTYPDFYRQLLDSGELRTAFLDALENEEDITIPEHSRVDLSFLAANVRPSPRILKFADGWRATWQRSVADLQELFNPSSPLAAPLRDAALLEDDAITLLGVELQVDDVHLSILLKVLLPVADAESIVPLLFITNPEARPISPLTAALIWGPYTASAVNAQAGAVCFPPLPYSAVLTDNDEVTADMTFSLSTET